LDAFDQVSALPHASLPRCGRAHAYCLRPLAPPPPASRAGHGVVLAAGSAASAFGRCCARPPSPHSGQGAEGGVAERS
jgi:hypothetical protein